MKNSRYLIPILLMISVLCFASDVTHLTVKAMVPEDYSVSFPEKSLHADHLFFTRGEAFVAEDGVITDIEFTEGSMGLDLLYYGNQEDIYNIEVVIPEQLFWMRDNMEVIPVNVAFGDSDIDDDISIIQSGLRSVFISVPPAGPRRGVKIASMVFDWDLLTDLTPGSLELALDVLINVE